MIFFKSALRVHWQRAFFLAACSWVMVGAHAQTESATRPLLPGTTAPTTLTATPMAAPAVGQRQGSQPQSWAEWPRRPTVIAHRGASALRPEHTLAAYSKAIEDGADLVEPDVVITRDGVLVARHENALARVSAAGAVTEATTDVADHPEFAARRTTKNIDGTAITGWFAEDFTLAELKTLRARERLAALRPGNVAYNGQFEIPTLQEVIDLASSMSAESGRVIGIYPEMKHPAYFRSIGLPLEEPMVELLRQNGWNDDDAPVFIQSFDPASLQKLRTLTKVRLVLLANAAQTAALRLNTPQGLRAVAAFADGIAPAKELVIADNAAAPHATALVRNAHAAGLFVHVYTLRPENAFLPARWKKPPTKDGTVRGDSESEIRSYLDAGVDGFFTDDPATGRAAISPNVSR